MQDYKKLEVWQKGHSLAKGIYQATRSFPPQELFGITSQIRRASVSIPANIAEGCGRESRPDFSHFLQISLGSANELEYHLLLSNELGLMDSKHYDPLNAQVNEIKGMLITLIRKLKTSA